MFLPGQGHWLGILGGGQLGRFLAIEARHAGYKVAVWSPGKEAPTAEVADYWSAAPWEDASTVELMAHLCQVITLEFENVPVSVLQAFEAFQEEKGLRVAPSSQVLQVTQNRLQEKALCNRLGLPTANWLPITTLQEVQLAVATVTQLKPNGTTWSETGSLLLKTAENGYDGKGQIKLLVNELLREALPVAWEQLGSVPCILEACVPLKQELSLLVGRNAQGERAHFPLFENVHEAGILATSTYPANLSHTRLEQQALAMANTLLTHWHYTGLLSLELFETASGQLLINELAPRTHNSGHLTLDAFDVNQFALQLHSVMGLPLRPPVALVGKAVMHNVLGQHWPSSPSQWGNLFNPMGVHQAHKVYLYGKAKVKPGRKMGHVTVLTP